VAWLSRKAESVNSIGETGPAGIHAWLLLATDDRRLYNE